MPTTVAGNFWSQEDSGSYPQRFAKELWDAKVAKEAAAKFTLKRLVGREGSDSPITYKNELGKEAGSVITMNMLGQLSGSGVTNNGILFNGTETNGESMNNYYMKVWLNARRNETYIAGLMAMHYTKKFKVKSQMASLLSDWMAAKWEDDFFDTMETVTSDFSLGNAPTELNKHWLFIGQIGSKASASVNTLALMAAVEADGSNGVANGSIIDPDALDMILGYAETEKIQKTKTPFGYGYNLIVHPYVAAKLRSNDDFRDIAMRADVRGEGNRLFKGFLGEYAGITILVNNRVNSTTIQDSYTGYRSYLLGANAAAFAASGKPAIEDMYWDFKSQYHVAIQHLYGMSANQRAKEASSVTYPTDYINQSSIVITSGVGDLSI